MAPIIPRGSNPDLRLHLPVGGTRASGPERGAAVAPEGGAAVAPVDRVELSAAARAPGTEPAAARSAAEIPVSTLDPARHREVVQRVVDRFYDRPEVRAAIAARLAGDVADAGESGAP